MDNGASTQKPLRPWLHDLAVCVDGNVTGLFYGDSGQFVAEAIGGLTNIVAVGLLTLIAWKLSSLVTGGARVSATVEDNGLDIPEMGALAYPTDAFFPESGARASGVPFTVA